MFLRIILVSINSVPLSEILHVPNKKCVICTTRDRVARIFNRIIVAVFDSVKNSKDPKD